MPSSSSTSNFYWNGYTTSPFASPVPTRIPDPKFKVGDICRVIKSGGYNLVDYPKVGRIVRIHSVCRFGDESEYVVKWFINGEWSTHPPEVEGELVRDSNLEIYRESETFEFSLPKGDVYVIPKKKVLSVKDETIATCEPQIWNSGEAPPMPQIKTKKVKVFTVEI